MVVVLGLLDKKSETKKGQLIFEKKWKSPGGLRQHFYIFENGIESQFCKHNSKQKDKRDPTKYYGGRTSWTTYKFVTFEQITSIHFITLGEKNPFRVFNTLRFVVDWGDGKYWLSDIVFEEDEAEIVLTTLSPYFGSRWKKVFDRNRVVLWGRPKSN
ncbi:MAG: hypothetical protein JSV56_03665 [Methanomassiliicoccales archaeon]|nr:MAG: hypothetical protein JSV56_03665 [Methanomassiliicoccales archaeon]